MKFKEIYRRIVSLQDYSPSEEVNALFSALVAIVIHPVSKEVLSPKKCACLQAICSHAEYELEKYWAREIINGNKRLADFPYLKNYKDLTRLEWNALDSCTDHHHHKVLFIGSGPLPMTAIMLARDHGIKSALIDNSNEAVSLSRRLIQTLGLEHMIKIVRADGTSFKNIKNFNVVFVAALAGVSTAQKMSVFRHIKKNTSLHCHIIARSSWGKRTFLYAPLPQSVYSLFIPLIEITPYNEIVNSVVIFKNSI
jgi:nicotianamine synthase